MKFLEIVRAEYDSQCDLKTLMNSLKSADENFFADGAVSLKSSKGLLWEGEMEDVGCISTPSEVWEAFFFGGEILKVHHNKRMNKNEVHKMANKV